MAARKRYFFANGQIVDKIQSVFLDPTDYSPMR